MKDNYQSVRIVDRQNTFGGHSRSVFIKEGNGEWIEIKGVTEGSIENGEITLTIAVDRMEYERIPYGSNSGHDQK